MRLITAEQCEQMLANGREFAMRRDTENLPVIKLFTPDAGCTWRR